MDIDLLSKMVKDLILKSDKVALPGVGTFVCELIPASFSDKGFMINPPYRRLSFRQRLDNEDTALVDLYASSNGVSQEEADGVLREFLQGMKDVLIKNKVIIFPGLGRLRATKENAFFFIPDEDLDIYPEGFGLESVSLKSSGGEPAPVPTQEPAAGPTPEPAPEPVTETATELAPAPAQETVPEPAPEPAAETATEPAPTPAQESVSEPVAETPAEPKPAKKKSRWFGRTVGILALVALLLLASLAIVGRVAPELVDKFLYSAEELQILNS